MDIFQQIILAIVQAILEWLPVSSEGFIVLLSVNVFQETELEAIRIAIYFHLGTAIAVLLKYWRQYLDALFKDRNLLRFIIITTLFTGVVGIPVYLLLKEIFSVSNGMIITLIIGILLIVTGTLLRLGRLKSTNSIDMDNRKIGDEIALGACQGFAILPGISRSGTTMSYLLLRGFKKEDAFKMSFLISLPAVVGAIAFDFFFEDIPFEITLEYLILMAVVAVLGYLTMDLLLRLAKRVSFDVICYILSAITIILVIIFYVAT
ncbi:MAG: hypothetical protein GF364_01070 [Candidatus Lokiarchaeota archaeon]|nr:hypothetical protein [Candidatus Lokiarchaeota archaeon]